MRKRRILKENAMYHVGARINNKEMLLKSNELKALFLAVVKRAKKKYIFQLTNFVVMENHIHMIIKPGKNQNLSRIMQWVLSVFAVICNKKLGRSGHLWGERFFSKIISSLQEYIKISDYIDNNPVKAGLASGEKVWKFSGKYHRLVKKYSILENPEALALLF